MKAVDYFMLTSFGFIFTALVEYIVVLNTPGAFLDCFYCFKKEKKNEPIKVQVISLISEPWGVLRISSDGDDRRIYWV